MFSFRRTIAPQFHVHIAAFERCSVKVKQLFNISYLWRIMFVHINRGVIFYCNKSTKYYNERRISITELYPKIYLLLEYATICNLKSDYDRFADILV